MELALTSVLDRSSEDAVRVSMPGLALAGLVAGLVSAFFFPHRLITTQRVLPGLSLVLAPLVTGCAMYFVGKRLRSLGKDASCLATFRGGALFAFAMALVRWYMVGPPR